jgi:hypothetical protein
MKPNHLSQPKFKLKNTNFSNSDMLTILNGLCGWNRRDEMYELEDATAFARVLYTSQKSIRQPDIISLGTMSLLPGLPICV